MRPNRSLPKWRAFAAKNDGNSRFIRYQTSKCHQMRIKPYFRACEARRFDRKLPMRKYNVSDQVLERAFRVHLGIEADGQKDANFDPEKRFLSLETAEIRAKKGEKGTVLTGYAAKFDRLSQDLGGFVEKIDKKAFDRCLKRCDVRGLKNHDPAMLLGRTKSGTMRLSVDDVGLLYDIDLPDTQIGRDLVTEIERGDIDGSSFSFNLESEDGDEWDDSTSPPTRTLRNVRDLFDVGPVAYPAYLDTSSSVRAYASHVESRVNLPSVGRLQFASESAFSNRGSGFSLPERGNSVDKPQNAYPARASKEEGGN